jgi:hypothetical protein
VVGDEEVRAKLSAAGPQKAGKFSWRLAAQQTLRILEAAAR